MDRNEYLEIVSAQIRCKRAVPYLREELEDHIQDQKDAYIDEGMNPFEAEMAAVKEMGDPVETGVQLDQVHRPKMDWKIFVGVILLGILGAMVQTSILMAVNSEYRFQELLSHATILAIGIAIMVIICYIDYSLLGKYARVLWCTLVILLFLSCVCELPILYRPVNGVNKTNWVIAYFMCPVYPAFVYSWHRQGRKGFLMSFFGLILFNGLLMADMPLGWVAKFCVRDLIIFGYAMYKKWFGINKNDGKTMAKYGVCVLAGFVIRAIYEVINYGYHDLNFVPQYYIERLKVFFSGNVTDYIAEEIKVYLQNGGNMIESQFLQEHMQNDYIWLFITEYLGTMAGILIAMILAVFVFYLIRKIFEQKNMLGKFVASACTLLLVIEIFFYIGGNFGVTPFLGCFMPFLGDGKVVTIVTYFYMGILLSVFRNTNVVRN